MDLYDKINLLIETQYNKVKEEEKIEFKKLMSKKRGRNNKQLKQQNNNNEITDLEKQVLDIAKIEKRCKLLIVEPQKFIRLQSMFFLKNGAFIDEDLIFQQINISNNVLQEKIKHNLSTVINNYKGIDYILHENENSISLNHPEFICIKFKNQQKIQTCDDYLKQRFDSFGNVIFKKFAEQIENLKNVYQNIQNPTVFGKLVQEENNQLKLTGGQINTVMQLIEQILVYYQNVPVQMFHLRVGENGMVIDPQSINFNKCYFNKCGYTIEEAISKCMKEEQVFDSFSFTDALKVNKLIEAQDAFHTKFNENFTIMQDFEKGVFQLTLKNGKSKDVSGKFGITKQGLNCFTYVIAEQIYD